MPNWCFNVLIVKGSEKDLSSFMNKAKFVYKHTDGTKEKTGISLQKFLPLPNELVGTQSPVKERNKELIKKYGSDNWYDWHLKNWGTKWDIIADLNRHDIKRGELQYTFNSAWSPPCEAFISISRKFPNLKFTLEYEEGGMGFYGRLVANDGWHTDECNDMRYAYCKNCNEEGETQQLTWSNECPECGDILKPKKEKKVERAMLSIK